MVAKSYNIGIIYIVNYIMKVLQILFLLILVLFSGSEPSLYAETVSGRIEFSSLSESKSMSDKEFHTLPLSIKVKKTKPYLTFSDWINKRKYRLEIDRESERQKLREQWQKTIGIDLFFPFFKIHDIKATAENKSELNIFKLKGKAKLSDDEAKYIFKVSF